MGSDGKTGATREEFVADSIERMMRERIRETIEGLVAAELEAALGAARNARLLRRTRLTRHPLDRSTGSRQCHDSAPVDHRAASGDQQQDGREGPDLEPHGTTCCHDNLLLQATPRREGR